MKEEATREAKKESEAERQQLQTQIEDIKKRSQEEIDELSKDPRFSAWYTVDRPPDGWAFSTGFINEEMCREHLPLPAEDTFTFICGPPPMIKFACMPSLVDTIGHDQSRVLCF